MWVIEECYGQKNAGGVTRIEKSARPKRSRRKYGIKLEDLGRLEKILHFALEEVEKSFDLLLFHFLPS